jgi:hypothetical protein
MGVVRLLLLLLLALPLYADISFTARPMAGGKLPSGKGQCDIRLSVDDAVDVTVRGDRVDVHTVSGADAKDAGSQCNAPLPKKDFDGFVFSVRQKRNQMQLSESPGIRNGYKATVFIRDSAPGAGQYWFRLTWKIPPPEPPAGMSFNNTIHSTARGHGEARLDDAAAVPLSTATVDYDRSGHIFVLFTTAHSAPVSFGGAVMSLDGGVLKADIASDDRFDNLRGPMYVYYDGQHQVYKIEMQGTDGQEHLRLKWEKGSAAAK